MDEVSGQSGYVEGQRLGGSPSAYMETARTGGTGHLLQSRATELLELDAEEDMVQRQLAIDFVAVQGATRVDMTAG